MTYRIAPNSAAASDRMGTDQHPISVGTDQHPISMGTDQHPISVGTR